MEKADMYTRFIAFWIDGFIACLIASPLIYFGMPTKLDPLSVFRLPYSYVAIALILLKDISGRSIGKWILKLSIISENGEKPPIWKRIVRNLTCCIWPIEALIALISKDGARLADKLLGTRVITYRYPFLTN